MGSLWSKTDGTIDGTSKEAYLYLEE